MLELEQLVSTEAKNVNRVVYVITDMRRHDWEPEGEAVGENHPTNVLGAALETDGGLLS